MCVMSEDNKTMQETVQAKLMAAFEPAHLVRARLFRCAALLLSRASHVLADDCGRKRWLRLEICMRRRERQIRGREVRVSPDALQAA